ncbi:phosphopantetheine-binding protein [Hymenobacter sp. DH14]|uniref:Acyl carrier protein n=1 Tax=Hymenobacter cyanobacteriorum TaxID=2926463 RepID=A0A9X1VCI1_9BACT|nr:phosphopantetheine-binding protein [Hymenobacter cyanobacteriorum]MCI1186376.1 phosphopantetheine-binding protein [Hymenobacter cyanobacteriorum]
MEAPVKTKAEVISTINEFLSEEFEVDIDTIQPDANLNTTLGLDSLDYIDLVVMTESNFGFKVKPEDFPGIKTFNDFYQYIFAKIGLLDD